MSAIIAMSLVAVMVIPVYAVSPMDDAELSEFAGPYIEAASPKGQTAHVNVWQKTIRVDGVPIGCYDFQDNYVRTFAIKGTVYIPLRTACELLGTEFEWLPAENVLCLTTMGEPYLRHATLDQIHKERTEAEQRAWIDQIQLDQKYGMDATLCTDVTILLDGVEQTMANALGEQVYPAYIRGEFFLPLRSVGEMMGKQIQWIAPIVPPGNNYVYLHDFDQLYLPWEPSFRNEMVLIFDEPTQTDLEAAQMFIEQLQTLYDEAFSLVEQFRTHLEASKSEARATLTDLYACGKSIQALRYPEQTFMAHIGDLIGACGWGICHYTEETIAEVDGGFAVEQLVKKDSLAKNISSELDGLLRGIREGQDLLNDLTERV